MAISLTIIYCILLRLKCKALVMSNLLFAFSVPLVWWSNVFIRFCAKSRKWRAIRPEILALIGSY